MPIAYHINSMTHRYNHRRRAQEEKREAASPGDAQSCISEERGDTRGEAELAGATRHGAVVRRIAQGADGRGLLAVRVVPLATPVVFIRPFFVKDVGARDLIQAPIGHADCDAIGCRCRCNALDIGSREGHPNVHASIVNTDFQPHVPALPPPKGQLARRTVSLSHLAAPGPLPAKLPVEEKGNVVVSGVKHDGYMPPHWRGRRVQRLSRCGKVWHVSEWLRLSLGVFKEEYPFR